jgi:hypothetical protein
LDKAVQVVVVGCAGYTTEPISGLIL